MEAVKQNGLALKHASDTGTAIHCISLEVSD